MTSNPSPPISLELGKNVLAVELFDFISNELFATYHREPSRCSFTDKIVHAEYEIILRVDWGDLNDGEPVLDMDVYRKNPDGSTKRIKPRGASWHHTALPARQSNNSNPRTYDVEFEGLCLRLVAKKSFGLKANLSAYIVDPTTTEDAGAA